MEITTVLIYVTTACVGGFMFLLGWVMKIHEQLHKRPTFEWAEKHMASKEVIEVKLENLRKDVHAIKEAVEKIAKNGHK